MDEKPIRTRKKLWYDRVNDKWEIIDEIVQDIIIEIPAENVRHYFYGNGDTKTEKILKRTDIEPHNSGDMKSKPEIAEKSYIFEKRQVRNGRT